MGYIGICRCEGYGFQAVYSRIGLIGKSGRLGLEQGIIFQLTDQLVEDFIQTRDCSIRFCFGQTVLVTSVVFWKTSTLGQRRFGEFTLVQGSKIQLNQLWYRLRVPGSQRHIPTQKFLKYPRPHPREPYVEKQKRSECLPTVLCSLSD